MKTNFVLCITALTLSGHFSTAPADTPTTWKGGASIKFEGTSTLHDWSGTVKAQPFATTVTMNDAGQPTAIKAKVEVKAAEMDTRKTERDENMHKAMKVASFPLISGEFDAAYASLKPAEKLAPKQLPFKLTILGKEQNVSAAISNWKQNGSKATFDAEFDLSLKACGIEVPSVMLVIRVGDTVKVKVSVELTKENP